MSEESFIVIIGAGAVGLAIAAELSRTYQNIFVLEKNRAFGLETSSRNSEVIHAGLYYPGNSLKAEFCVEGNRMIYEICEKYNINHKQTGKIIVAADEAETGEVEKLYNQGIKNGVKGLRLLSGSETKRLEPDVRAVAGLLSPVTGIVDSYYLMRSFHGQAKENGAEFVYNTEVTGITGEGSEYNITVKDREGISSLTADIVINCAGLFSDRIAQSLGIDTETAGYKLHYCKGEYFSIQPGTGLRLNRLIYPVPEEAGLGVHVTLSLDGGIRLGPNAKYVDDIDYTVDESSKQEFYQAAKRYLPSIEPDDLSPDFAGIRPKLRNENGEFRDFVIREESDKGFPGFINLVGIESPGLTASPAIAKYVASLVAEATA